MRKRWIALGAAALLIGAVGVFNAPFRGAPQGELTLLAHRGVHQDFAREGLTNETCTAERIHPLTHAFIENTLPSMQAAFDAGASMIEIDVHPTADGEFAVFHDWTLDCRTDGAGVTRQQTMAYLRTLDAGHGYTADGGETYPLRGQGVGLIPALREVLSAFPERRFLINFKSNDPREGELMLAYLDALPEADFARLAFFGAAPAERIRALRPGLRATGRRMLGACAKAYVLTGWFGALPDACRDTIVFVPVNFGWAAWGYPHLLLERMQRANTDVVLVGPINPRGRVGMVGIDDAEALSAIPRAWRGGVATDRIEIVGPLAGERARP